MIENRLDAQYRVKNTDLEQRIYVQRETNQQLIDKKEELMRQIEAYHHSSGDQHTSDGPHNHSSDAHDSEYQRKAKQLETNITKLRQEIDRVRQETQKALSSAATSHQTVTKRSQFDMDDF